MRRNTNLEIVGDSTYFLLARRSQDLETEDDATMATNDDMPDFPTRAEFAAYATSRELAEEINKLSERMYGVEDRLEVTNSRLDIMKDQLRGDIKLALERIDGLRELIERKAEEGQKERAADQQLLYALVKDHNRRLRALERLERRQRTQAPPH